MLKGFLELFSGQRTRDDDEEDAHEVEETRAMRHSFGIHSSESDEDDDDGTGSTGSGDSASTSTTEGTTTTESSSTDAQQQLLAPLTRFEARWRASAYLSSVPSRLYRLECGQMARCAALLARHVTPLTPHYLLDPVAVAALPLHLRCYDIYIEREQRGLPIKGLGDTFLVQRALHYIYSYLVDYALRARQEPDAVRKQRRQWLQQKRRRMHFCPQRHAQNAERYCPVEWVIYTRQSGPFAQFVQRIMDNNLCIDYTMQPHCVPQESLSYHLVNYLCAPTDLAPLPRLQELVGVERVEERDVARDEYLDWVTVPLFFLDIWNARAQTEAQRALQ